MELKYGHRNTYQHALDKERLEWLSKQTNRSNSQTEFLYQLVDGNFEKLKELEEQLKNCFVFGCPDSKEELEEVMSKSSKNKWFVLDKKF
jgi:hypothetical protein